MSVTGLNGNAMLVQHRQDSSQTIYQLMKLPIHGHQNPDKSEEQQCQAVRFERGHGRIQGLRTVQKSKLQRTMFRSIVLS